MSENVDQNQSQQVEQPTATAEQSTEQRPDDQQTQPDFTGSIEKQTVKENIQRTYNENSELKHKVLTLENQLREQEIQALKAAGKAQEALEMENKQLKEQLNREKASNVQLTRDNAISHELSKFEFASDAARKMAVNEIQNQLIQNEIGDWVTRAGQTISETIVSFSNDDQFKFLFKSVQSKGNASMQNASFNASDKTGSGLPPQNKPMKDWTQAEMDAALSDPNFDPRDGNDWFRPKF